MCELAFKRHGLNRLRRGRQETPHSVCLIPTGYGQCVPNEYVGYCSCKNSYFLADCNVLHYVNDNLHGWMMSDKIVYVTVFHCYVLNSV